MRLTICLLSVAFLGLTGVLAPACDSGDGHSHEGDTADDGGGTSDDGGHGAHMGGADADPALTMSACSLMTGAGTVAAAATAAAADAAAPMFHDTRVEVSLVAVDNGNGGYLQFTADEAGDHLFFFDNHFSMKVFNADGAEMSTASQDHEIDTCTDVLMVLTFELVAGTYDLWIGPTSLDTVSIVHLADTTGGAQNHEMTLVPDEYADLTNPHSGEAAVTAGGELYASNCAACHGEGLAGDGAGSAGLDPAPGDLADADFLAAHGDDYLYWRITEGGAMEPFESSMPGYGGSLTDEERWQIVAFIRSHGADHVMDGDSMDGDSMDDDSMDGDSMDGDSMDDHAMDDQDG